MNALVQAGPRDAELEPLRTSFDLRAALHQEVCEFDSARITEYTDAEHLSKDCNLVTVEAVDNFQTQSFAQENAIDEWLLGLPTHYRRKGSCFTPRDSRFEFHLSAMTYSDKVWFIHMYTLLVRLAMPKVKNLLRW